MVRITVVIFKIKNPLNQDITPVLPYTRPRGKKWNIIPKNFIYYKYYYCCPCTENQILSYSTTNLDGCREYKSNPNICTICSLLSRYSPYLEGVSRDL